MTQVFDSNGIPIISNMGGGGGGGAGNNINLSGNTTGTYNSQYNGSVYLAGGNNVTLSASSNSISINAASQSVQTQAAGAIAGTGFSTTTTTGLSILGTHATNGLNLAIPAYITTYASQTVQTQASGGIAGTGFTTAATAGSVIVGTQGSNGLSLGVPAYLTGYTQTTQSYNILSASGNTSGVLNVYTSGTIVLSGGNNITLSQTSNTIGISAANQTSLSFSNTNGVTFGVAGSTLTASVNTNYAGTGFSGTNVSGTVNTNGVQLSVAAQTAQPVAVSGSNGSFVFSTLSMGNSNGLSFYTSNGSVVGSYTVPTQSTQPVAVSGSNGSFAFSTLSMGNSNGISFYTTNGSVVASYTVPTQSVQTYNVISASGNTTGTLATFSTGTIVFAGGNNITLSQSSNSITISGANVGGVQTGISGMSAGTTQATSGTVSFANSNGVSFGMNGNTMTASINTMVGTNTTFSGTNVSGSITLNSNGINLALSAPNVGGAQTGISGIIAGTQTQTSGTLSFANSNGVSFGLSNSSVLTASFAAPTINVSAGTTSSNVQSIVFSNSNGLSFGLNGNTVTGSYTTPTQTAYVFSNSNNVSFGTNGSTVTATASFAQTNQTVASGNIAGTGFTSTTVGGVVPSATLSTNGLLFAMPSYITTYAAQTNQTLGLYVSSNTFGTSSTTVDARSLTVVGQGEISVGMSAGSLVISAAVDPIYPSGIIAGTQTATSGSVSFANSNNITFGMSNSSVITASYSQTNQTIASGGIAGTGTTFSGTNVSGSITLNSNGINLALSAGAGGGGGIYNAAGTQTATSGTVVFSNSNNVSFGMSNSSIVTASFSQSVQTQQTASLFAVGNTTSGSSGSTSSPVMYFSGAGIASVGVSNNSVIISVPSGGGGGDGYNIVSMLTSTSGGGTAGATFSTLSGSIGFMAGSNITLSQTSNTIVFNAPSVSQYFSNTGTTFGGTNISMSITQNTNGLVISASAPTGGGGGGFTGSWWQPEVYGNTMTSSLANGTVYFRPFELDGYYDVDKMLMQQVISSQLTSTVSFSASVSGGSASSGTGSWGQSNTLVWFTRQNTNETNASYNSVVSYASNTYSIGQGYSASLSWSTNASSATASMTTAWNMVYVGHIDGAGGVTYTTTSGSGSTTFSSTSNAANSFSSSYALTQPYQYISGMRPLFIPQSGSNVPPGEYWLGLIQSTNTGSTNMPLHRPLSYGSQGILMYTASSNNTYLEMGNSNQISSSNWRLGFGSYSSSGNTTTAIALTQITTMASNASYWFALDGKTY